VFDEFALDLAVLFDRFSPQGRLFPRESALLALLDLINHADLESLWAEDETIGWIYQYFNSKEERKKMRDESAAPRNSRELAVRNQFFTPRYVVEFLTDNTLGRIWYEMTKGETSLKDTCRYLVRRPTEVFLANGELPPDDQGQMTNDLSQEDLLKQSVYIPHRPLKDPRDIRMLDPACGSMHFGLYAFDLFETIYAEAWDLQAAGQWLATDHCQLTTDYETKDALLRDVPRLIIERNIHGIDIDPRAVQIAGLSLWLRAQRSWQAQGVKPQHRPQVQRSNVVCAEPMPGEESLLQEFLEKHLSGDPERQLLGQLVRRVFDSMKLAGEAGSLLKIEEEIAASVAEAKKAWLARPEKKQRLLFDAGPKLVQQDLGLNVAGITDEAFWAEAEDKIYASLRAYAEHAENGGGYQRRLFADDAARGFAFVDLCGKTYEVLLMNPPFGDVSTPSKPHVDRVYTRTRNDIYAAFVERGLGLLRPGAKFGAITSRTGFFLSSFQKWREELLLHDAPPTAFADLGHGVLDTAMVETTAYCLTKVCGGLSAISDCVFFRLLDHDDKGGCLVNMISALRQGQSGRPIVHVASPTSFRLLPGTPFAYWRNEVGDRQYLTSKPLDPAYAEAARGITTCDDFRFVRLSWEVSPTAIGRGARWIPLAKGGDFSPFYSDIPTLVDWWDEGKILRNSVDEHGKEKARFRGEKNFYRSGLTYPNRNTKGFNTRVLPAECVISHVGQAIFPLNERDAYPLLALTNSKVFEFFLKVITSHRHWEVGVIQRTPIPLMNETDRGRLTEAAAAHTELSRSLDTSVETSHVFILPTILQMSPQTLTRCREMRNAIVCKVLGEMTTNQNHIDQIAFRLYGISDADRQEIEGAVWRQACVSDADREDADEDATDVQSSTTDDLHLVDELLSYCLGCAFGRWDISIATGQIPLPKLRDPFAPLPVCPPGMLQNDIGFPLTSADERKQHVEGKGNYPLQIPWDGVLADEPGHPLDIEAKVREVLEIIWQGCADVIEREACEILAVRTVREFFRRPVAFFEKHLKRYSKSRRQAPIYWPLSTPSCSYTLWLYYHRLTDQTLYTCVNDFVEPKLKQLASEVQRLQAAEGRGRRAEKEYEDLTRLELELRDFRAELLRLAKFWKPNLNDGVQITAAPLWKLFQYRPWQKKLKETWAALEAGKYDWAHLACSIWPDRVREKCKTDKSLAIAHGLEELYQEPEKPVKKKRGGKK